MTNMLFVMIFFISCASILIILLN